MNKENCEKFFQRFQNQNPQPKTELNYSTPFQLLVAVMLSAQATDVSVNKATKELFAIATNPQDILNLGIEKLKSYIQVIGLYNSKAKHLMESCKILLEKHGGAVPNTREELEELPGVGRKTANVILNAAFGQPTIAVDTHIFRVSNRTGIAPGKNVLEVEKGLLEVIPEKYKTNAHHWLILHGRYTCKARKPECMSCIVQDLCEYPNKK